MYKKQGAVLSTDEVKGTVTIIFYAGYKEALDEMPPGSIIEIGVKCKGEGVSDDK